MDEGKLHDRLGKEGDFSNSIVLFTSNVGSEWLTKQLESGNVPSTTQIMEVMGQHFRPEFLARLSEIVPFSPIPRRHTPENIRHTVQRSQKTSGQAGYRHNHHR